MVKIPKIYGVLALSFSAWLVSMGFLYHEHNRENTNDELGYISSDIKMDSENKRYYAVYKNGEKIGYRTESWVMRPNVILCTEETVIKMNLAGLSREIFFQSAASIDSSTYTTPKMIFSIGSGRYSYSFDGTLQSDSLSIEVKNHYLLPPRRGIFIVDNATTFPSTLPFFIHRTDTETMSFKVFDPILFDDYFVHCARRGVEQQVVDGRSLNLMRYDLIFRDRKSTVWLGRDGGLVKAEGFMFFGGELGELSIEQASHSDVFMLPLEVSLGNDIIKNLRYVPNQPIQDPRSIEYMKIEIDGIRAANIDVTASNKEIVSVNPVVFGIYNKPVIEGARKQNEIIIAGADTTVLGTSDYIQPKDARMIRGARAIVDTEQDTLRIARAINQWVFNNVITLEGLDMVRSVDILRERKGGCDERTKLFTALTRSIGIRTQINLGLVYRDGVFRYHSWPSVFSGGVWHDLDPTFGQDRADATHISLVRGDFDHLIELLRIAGKMSINVIEYR